MKRHDHATLEACIAGLLMIFVVAGCDALGGSSGDFECGSDVCDGQTEYCETVLPPLSNDPISETCKAIPGACGDLAAQTCDPDDDAQLDALGECVLDAIGEPDQGYSWSCFGESRELYITIIQE